MQRLFLCVCFLLLLVVVVVVVLFFMKKSSTFQLYLDSMELKVDIALFETYTLGNVCKCSGCTLPFVPCLSSKNVFNSHRD